MVQLSFRCLALSFLFLSLQSIPPSLAVTSRNVGQRLALVIGNSAYQVSPLLNPSNDARDMAGALEKADFEVILETDADHRTMERAIRLFGRQLRSGGVGLFYYAGHGLQISGRNYLVPVDALIESESDVQFEGVDAGRVLGKMEDAGNGRYTSKRRQYIHRPGSKIEDLFKQVRREVMQASGDNQVPWESFSMDGDFYFTPKLPGPEDVAPEPAGPDPGILARLEALEAEKQSQRQENKAPTLATAPTHTPPIEKGLHHRQALLPYHAELSTRRWAIKSNWKAGPLPKASPDKRKRSPLKVRRKTSVETLWAFRPSHQRKTSFAKGGIACMFP